MAPWATEIQTMDVLRMGWIKSQIDADEKKEFDERLALAEHIASFINPEAVKQVQGSRKSAVKVTDDNFLRTVASISGAQVAEQVASTLKKK